MLPQGEGMLLQGEGRRCAVLRAPVALLVLPVQARLDLRDLAELRLQVHQALQHHLVHLAYQAWAVTVQQALQDFQVLVVEVHRALLDLQALPVKVYQALQDPQALPVKVNQALQAHQAHQVHQKLKRQASPLRRQLLQQRILQYPRQTYQQSVQQRRFVLQARRQQPQLWRQHQPRSPQRR